MRVGRMKFNDHESAIKLNQALIIRISKYFQPYWRHTLLVMVILCLTSSLGILPSIFIQYIIDQALPEKDLRFLCLLVIASLTTTMVSGLLGVWQSYLNAFISQNIVYDMKNQMYRHLQKMPLQFFSTVKQGEVITRMTSDISGIQGVFNGTVVSFFNNILVLSSTAIALIMMNWKLALLGMFAVPLFIFPTRKMSQIRWKLAKQTQEKMSEENQIIQETLSFSGYILMKLFTREEKEYEGFKAVNAESARLQIRESTAGRWFIMVMTTFTSIGPMLIYLYGGYLFIQGEITIGAIIAFVTLLGRLYGPVNQLTSLYIDIKRSLALFERIFEYFDMELQINDHPHAVAIENNVIKDIKFQNVTFSYQNGNPTLQNISFIASAGKMTALVGASGSGKTTITNLILRLYDIDSGSITIGGIDIRLLTLQSLRSQIGLVTQETYLFNGTIKENLQYANYSAPKEEMINACKAAYIHEFIINLPNGYDTVVGNRGVKLSGGEKQRISIARVLLKNPPIIIMDEATSSLDAVSEYYIRKAMDYLLMNKTSIVIAHRLSTINNASHIIVVNDGRIAEEGDKEHLLGRDGVYKELYERQFGMKRDMQDHTLG
ncbi:ABC transporter ATP-binding protein [Paenibacillus pseudetheri]|uniref:ABC transporter ATP-binding protein n=1 Tax=Paenibacillus pseudetheri TaxID=2897682 RepID=A0ABM9BKU5_9BACL|nr:ABC transporter ATP-binding protein [Paenibacillus pseudetheri]CAH1059042.1 putative ABC transporter ATP-binding protein [Paenibacillus pseudetheri]